MKKLFLSLFSILLVISCEKKNTETVATTNDSVIGEITENILPPTPLVEEATVDETTNLLNTKNDTLYITNFFATWCGPCRIEMPHFVERIEKYKDQPVKITFVSLDSKTEWETSLSNFVDEYGIRKNTIAVDDTHITPEFFALNFKTWKGETIPFTHFRKGDKVEEINGSLTPEKLDQILSTFLN